MEIKRVGNKLTADGSVVQCPDCGSEHIWKVGPVPTRSGPKLRVKCADCACTFFPKAVEPAPVVEPKVKAKPKKKKPKAKAKSSKPGKAVQLSDAVSLKPDEMFEDKEQE